MSVALPTSSAESGGAPWRGFISRLTSGSTFVGVNVGVIVGVFVYVKVGIGVEVSVGVNVGVIDGVKVLVLPAPAVNLMLPPPRIK